MKAFKQNRQLIAGIIIGLFAALLISAYIKQEISVNVLDEAEKVIGLNFTEQEKDSMLDNLNQSLEDYKKIRSVNLDNIIFPSLIFNPLPTGFMPKRKQLPLEFSDYSSVQLPENNNDLAYYSIGELAELIRTKKISSIELTKFFIERLKKYDNVLKCVITITEERALQNAELADEEIARGHYKGKLHGIPFGVKDLLATKDYKTTWGAMPYKDQFINADATVIKKLEEAGAVLVAKLTMGALAWGDVWFGGKTRNPWDTSQGSSGSSAGPGSAVSAGLIPFAIGTETWDRGYGIELVNG